MGHEGHDHHHHEEHEHGAVAVSFSVIRVAAKPDANDLLLPTISRLLEGAGHTIVQRENCLNKPSEILKALETAQHQNGARAVIIIGGTGLGRSDVTIETVAPLLTKTIPGFGDWVRAESAKSTGTHSFFFRAEAGLMNAMLIFVLPDELHLATKTVTSLVIPHIAELVNQAVR